MPFDESDGLRQTFATASRTPLEVDALRRVLKMLDRLLLEDGSFWGELEESGTAAEARAAVVDLRYLQHLSRLDPDEFDPKDDAAEHRLTPAIKAGLAVKSWTMAELVTAAMAN
jgi:hypothetical protein